MEDKNTYQQSDDSGFTVIKPQSSLLDLNLRELWRYRDLIVMYVKRDIVTFYKQTILGPLWFVIQPILTTIMFMFVFGNLAGISTDGVPGVLFYFSGIIIWNYFADCLNRNSRTFTDNQNVFGKVYFPRLVMPFATVLSEMINFLVQFVIFIPFVIYYALQPDSAVNPNFRLILLTPLMLIQLGILGLGFGIIISALTTKYRDLAMLVTFGVHLWMYATPVTYSTSLIAEKFPNLLGLYMLNPITPIIEQFRAAYLGVPGYATGYTLLSVGVTALVFLLGVALFTHTEKTFMDTV